MQDTLMTKNVVFLGDYIDRGPNSFGVVTNLYLALRKNPSWVALIGNHELMLIENIEQQTVPISENSLLESCSGTNLTFCYRFFKSLPTYHETEHLIFVHGGVDKSYLKVISEINYQELVWTYGVNRRYTGKKIARGHEVVDSPTEYTNNIACQTALFHGVKKFCISIIANCSSNKKLLGYLQIDLESLNCELVLI